jgi:hypothetical protein
MSENERITPLDILNELKELGKRIKALEDMAQNITRVMLAPPNHTKPEKQSALTLGWKQIPTGPKGPWEKNNDISNPDLQAIITEMHTANKTFLEKDGFLYWQLNDKESGVLNGLGRRQK